ncbi:MarR family winged helix-turn-helix transcriptional regulator [Streptomyces inhibens]|uniref:MarR family winged helix-turn-helix transcriptional regulator n=1 Tax=Streptomyces inhibens TaxID=2293571 RepID=UPI001EE722F6|nr:MarR family transcriptional regulator [Streptomyces inhibens]UKY49475.1 MarR family transcriptional regulator [Streptomyces inhibens]
MSEQRHNALLRQHADSYRAYVTATVLHGQAAAEALGQHPTDLYALHALDLAGPLTTGALAERIGLSQSATTRLVDRLVRAGRARRAPDPDDRRRVLVEPLPIPHDEDEAAFGPARRRMAEVFRSFTADELRVLFRYFAAAAPALRDATAETKGLPVAGGPGS